MLDNNELYVDVPCIDSTTRKFYSDYVGLAPGEVETHVKRVRDKAYKIYPYPCLGQYSFNEFSLAMLPDYPEVLQRVKGGDKILDVGCCLGQNIRKLVADGAPPENIVGTDLQQDFINFGYEMYGDQEKLKVSFTAGDIFNESFHQTLAGHFDIVFAAYFIHLFDYNDQKRVMRQIAKFIRGKGGMILGQQLGSTKPKEIIWLGRGVYFHNQESFKQMWDEVNGKEWSLDASLYQSEWANRQTEFLRFIIRKL